MDSRTVLEVLRDDAGELIKVAVKSLSRYGAYFFTQCNKLNVEQSMLEETVRYKNKINLKGIR